MHNCRSMFSPLIPLLWIFVSVKQLNVPPWLGENRKDANQFNGLLAVTLAEMLFIHDIYVIISKYSGLPYPNTYLIPLAIFSSLLFVNERWLIKAGHGKKFIVLMNCKSAREKKSINLKSWSLLLTIIFVFFVMLP